jgi:anti-sigma B factor antagonist
MEERFEITEEEEAGHTRVTVTGELDLATADDLDARLATLAELGRPVLLDLRPLTFMDSSGLRALMVARERAERGWQLQIVAPEGDAREVLRISGVEDLLPLVSP